MTTLVSQFVASGVTGREAALAWLEARRIPIAEALRPALEGIWRDGYVVGAVSSRAVLAHHLTDVVKADDPATVTLGVDWGNWAPGDAAAATQLLSAQGMADGLAGMQGYSGRVLDGIEQTKLDQISRVLADGVAAGDAPATIAQGLRQVIDNPKWAARVAITETTRAVSAATLQRYAMNGVSGKSWATAGDTNVCTGLCQANEGDGAIPLDAVFSGSQDEAPPAHVNCRCSIYAEWLTAAEVAQWYEDNPNRRASDIGAIAGVPARAVSGPGIPAGVPKAMGAAVRQLLSQAQDAPAVSRAFEAEAARITGQHIPASLVGDVQTAREHAEGILRGLERFPEADLRGVETATLSASSYAEAEDGIIRFSADYTAEGARDDYLAALAKDESRHWLADGTASPTGVALHEFGHVVDIETVGEVGHAEITALVDAAAAKAGVDSEALIKFDVSRYAAEGRDTRELAAEAFGQVMAMGDAAPQLSRDIYDVLRRDYVAGGREIRPTGPTLARMARERQQYPLAPELRGPTARARHMQREEVLEDLGRSKEGLGPQGPGREEAMESLEHNGYVQHGGPYGWQITDKGRAYLDDLAAPKAPPEPKPPTLAALKKVVTDAGITVPTGAPRAVVEDLAAALQRGVEPAVAREQAVRAMFDLRRMVGDKLADVSAALENGASDRAMAFHARQLRRLSEPAAPGMGGLGRAVPELGKPLEPLIAALERGDAQGAKEALGKAVTGSKLKALGEVGSVVSRSTLGSELDWVGAGRGDVVHVMQPGYTSTIEGRLLTVSKPSVQAATAEQAQAFRAAQPVKRTPAAKTAAPKATPAKAPPRKAAAPDLTGAKSLSTDPAVREVQIENRIREAAASAGVDRGGELHLTMVQLRAATADLPRGEVDAAIQRMGRQRGVDVLVNENQKELTPADRAAAIHIGPQRYDYMLVQRSAAELRALPEVPKPAKATPAKATKAAPAKKAPAPKALPAPEKMSLPALKSEVQAAIDRANSLRLNQTTVDLALVPKSALAAFATRARGLTDQQLLEEVGRLRQTVINVRRSAADLLSQADQLVADGADAATLAARGAILQRQMGDIADWPDAAAAQKVVDAMATGDAKKIRAAFVAAEKKLGLVQVGEDAGSITTFDRAGMKPIGGSIDDGAHVVVVRPGYQLPDGTVLSKPVVEAATPQEVAAAAKPATPVKRTAAPPKLPQDVAARNPGATVEQRRLYEITSQPIADIREAGDGFHARTELETTAGGQQFVRKTFEKRAIRNLKESADAEELAALVGRTVGIETPAVVRVADNEIVMSFIKDATNGAEFVPWDGPQAGIIPQEIVDSPQGRLMGLFDLLINNNDRNAAGWFIRPDGSLVGIDHGYAWMPGQVPKMMIRQNDYFSGYLRDTMDNSGTNGLRQADMTALRDKLETLRPQFERLGRQDWFEQMMESMKQVVNWAQP